MPARYNKNQKPTKTANARPSSQNRTAQFIFAGFALLLILSMVLSAVSNF